MISLFLSLLLNIQQVQSPINLLDQSNVLIIILDDVGRQDVIEVDTPSIDALANKGIKFNRGYAQPVCAVTRYALMFGKYGESAGSICFAPDANTPDINWPSLPKLFKDLGYTTGMFGKWHLGGNALGSPWEQTPNLYGYDKVGAMVPGNVGADSCNIGLEGNYNEWLRVDDGTSLIDTHYNTVAIRNSFLTWWVQTVGPKFAYVSFQAAHAPFHEPPTTLLPHLPQGGPGYSTKRIRFEKMIISVDTILAQFAEFVDLDNTYIILIGDNGTPPDARSPQEPPGRYKTTVYEGGIRVPFIIAGPGIPQGVVSEELVSVVDILPTLAELLNGSVTVQDGLSFKPILDGQLDGPRDHVFVSLEGKRAVIQDRYKLVRNGSIEEIYDIIADPFEQTPITIDPVITQTLRNQMDVYLNRGF